MNPVDILHYHYIIDQKGKTYEGQFQPEDNLVCQKHQYAAHTGGGNSGSIGIAFAGMFGFHNRQNTGNYPLTKKQCEVGFELGARLIKKYNLNINEELTIQTHYGFGKRNPKTTSCGKIDIIFLPPYPDITSLKIINFFKRPLYFTSDKVFYFFLFNIRIRR